jgi:hypothetical protein
MCRLLLILGLLLASVTSARAAPQVEISNVSDIALGTWGMADAAPSTYFDICVYSGGNMPAGDYALTITSQNGGFFLANGTHQIPYALYWESSGASHLGTNSPGTLLTYGSKITGLANADTASSTCTLGIAPTARLTLKITLANMQAALAGTYTDKIYITISPV